MEKMTFGHTIGRLEAEIAWHDELLERLSALMAAGSGTPSGRLLRAVGRPGAGSGTPS